MTTTRPVWVLNGPNLGRLGSREPDVYGHVTHEDLVAACQQAGESLDLAVEVRQTDDESELIAGCTMPPTNRFPSCSIRLRLLITPTPCVTRWLLVRLR